MFGEVVVNEDIYWAAEEEGLDEPRSDSVLNHRVEGVGFLGNLFVDFDKAFGGFLDR